MEKFLYVLGEISPEQWENAVKMQNVASLQNDCQIYIDGYCDISLENWLNLQARQKENITVVY